MILGSNLRRGWGFERVYRVMSTVQPEKSDQSLIIYILLAGFWQQAHSCQWKQRWQGWKWVGGQSGVGWDAVELGFWRRRFS